MSNSRMPAAYAALALLFGINFLNYIDRYVISAVLPLIQAELHIDDTQAGLLTSMFIVVYMIASPFTGMLGDRFPRRYLVGSGVLLWSLATVASGLSATYHQLMAARSFIGIGEAGFGAVSPTIISDLFPREKRGRMLAFFYVAIPVGSALGYILGGHVGASHGWRTAFFVAGAPGLLLGLLAFRMYEPARGAGDGLVGAGHAFSWSAARGLLKVPSFVYTTFGMAAMTFALGGIATWLPTFFSRVKGMPVDEAGVLVGEITVAAGFVGTFLGGWLGDWLLKRTRRAYLLVSGTGMLLAVPFTLIGLSADDRTTSLVAIFLAEVLVFLNTGPANAVLVNVSLPEIRATAIAFSIFAYHLLGDALSPTLIGWVSDLQGLQFALSLTSVAMALSGVLYLLGTRTLGADTERVQAAVASQTL